MVAGRRWATRARLAYLKRGIARERLSKRRLENSGESRPLRANVVTERFNGPMSSRVCPNRLPMHLSAIQRLPNTNGVPNRSASADLNSTTQQVAA